MLRKLVKYELIATGRIMIPLFLAMIAATAAMGLNLRFNNGTGNSWILSLIVIFLFVAAIFAVVIISTLLILMRFHRNLLGEEGYLMFTLPATTLDHLLSKGLTALIWAVAAGATGVVCGALFVAILGGWRDFTSEIGYVWDALLTQGAGRARMYVFLTILAILVGILETTAKIYASIAVGHQWSDHRIVGSAIAYIGFGIIEVILAAVIHLPRMLSYRQVIEIEGINANIEISYAGLVIPILIAAAGILIYGFIAWYMMDRKLNLQ